MMDTLHKQVSAVILVMATIFALYCSVPVSCYAESKPEGSEADGTITLEIAERYTEYMKTHGSASRPDAEINIPGGSFSSSDYSPEVKDSYMGKDGSIVITSESGYVEWTFNVEQTGLYNIGVEYYPVAGKTGSIIRSVLIDGAIPYNEARNITFKRNWTDKKSENGKAIQQDPKGNDIRPMQEEIPKWMFADMRDSSGYFNEPLEFYFTQGTHTIRFLAVQEPMAISNIKLYRVKSSIKASELKQLNTENNYKSAPGEIIKIQGEDASSKTDPMLVPITDRSTPATEPSDVAKLKLNCIGGTNWQQAGQRIDWSFNIEKAGLYKIGIKALQNFVSGANSCRRIYIDGKVPVSELEAYEFKYSTEWHMNLLGGEEPYEFYFEEGPHTLSMEVTLGDMAQIIEETNEIVSQLNAIYRKILVLTGPVPDVNRDYQFDLVIPETIVEMGKVSQRLKDVYNVLIKRAGMKGANSQIFMQTYMQIDEMLKNTDTISSRFSSFQANINALAAWVASAEQQPLTIDYIVVAPLDKDLPPANASFFESLKYHIGSFFASFYVDYNRISYGDSKEAVTVWVGSGLTGGRDQAQILKSLSDNYFTTSKGISVDLQLVSMGALLPATLANKGPDVALSLGAGEAANYAFRGAALDLAQFEDFYEVAKRFSPSAMVPLTFGDMVYGIPEVQTFPMLFYRKDILLELGLKIPQTWDDVIKMLPVLQKSQLNFGLPSVTGVGVPIGSSMTVLNMLLYQRGGQLYTDDCKKTAINSQESIEAFAFYTKLYTSYLVPQTIDFINRFRNGSIPIGIADYSTYNALSVFAPELNGLWGFTSIPGTRKPDGTIDRSNPSGVMASLILSKAKNKENAWEFVKWWTSADIQVQFGRQLESIMGTASRYPTANLEALYQIPWSKENYDALMEQWKTVIGIPEVPGGYYTPRYVDFAFRKIIFYGDQSDPEEALLSAATTINSEIRQKRKEFGLPE